MINKFFSARNPFFFTLVLALILVTPSCGGSASIPSGTEPLPELTMAVLAPTQQVIASVEPESTQVAPLPAIPETRRLTLEFPPKMRAGVEGDVVRLTLEVDALGNIAPTAVIEGHVLTGEAIEIPDLYETHNVTAEARLDLAGMEVSPPGSILEPLTRGRSATFYWSIHPQDAGVYRGTAWLHLNFVDKSTGRASRIAVSAQIIEIEAVDFLGLSVNVARTSGVIGSVIGGVLGFPFLENILKFLLRRRKP